jgi:hypothetical protein
MKAETIPEMFLCTLQDRCWQNDRTRKETGCQINISPQLLQHCLLFVAL